MNERDLLGYGFVSIFLDGKHFSTDQEIVDGYAAIRSRAKKEVGTKTSAMRARTRVGTEKRSRFLQRAHAKRP
jgi:hypothetical protein